MVKKSGLVIGGKLFTETVINTVSIAHKLLVSQTR